MYEKELKAGIKAVRASEKTFLKYFGTKNKVQIKGGNYRDLASYADRKIEQDIKKELLRQFPEHGFIGEESAAVNTESQFAWVLDPIDGTTNYLHGQANCCIALALLKNGKPVVGIVSAPILRFLYTAAAGGPAKLNGKKIRASKVTSLRNAFAGLGWGRNADFGIKSFSLLLKKVFKLRIPASAALAFCDVARGSFDFYLQAELKLWDYAAAQVILEQAGGVFIDGPKIKTAAGTKSLAAAVTKLLR